MTFLFTDIEGSTRLFRRLGDDYVALLDRHHQILRAVWAAFHGVEVKTEGDSFFVAFADPAQAVEAAMAAQAAIRSEDWPVPLRVRIGVHSGLAAPRHGDYIAYAVHQAARVVGAAHGGQTLVTGETRQALTDPHLALRSLGRYRVRDFDEPVELFEALPADAAHSGPAPRATPAMGHNLTRAITTFLGRDDDLSALGDLIRPATLVSIVGPGGSGKTRLAVELGLAQADRWPDGVWLVELAAIAQETPIAGVVAETLGTPAREGDPRDALVAGLAGSTALVILDNCEHVVEQAADLVDDLLRQAPTVAVLTTSREPLGLAGERVWRLEPLLAGGPALDLFIDRAGLEPPLPDGDRAVVERICQRLGGNPLAIELAAARAATVGLAGLESALDDRFRVLSSRRRDVEPRQRSMMALLDWSHDLLLPMEQTVFQRLAVFRDRFTLDGAEVATGDGADAGEVIDAFWAVVDKSLLVVDGSANETRYAMSETVRDYALTRLDPSDRTAVSRRLADWYRDRFGLWKHFDPAGLSDLRLEIDNVRGMIDEVAATEPSVALTLATTIAYLRDVSGELADGIVEVDRYLHRLGHPSAERALLLAAASRLRHRRGITDYGSLLDEAERLLAAHGPEPDWATGAVATMRAYWLHDTGQVDRALEAAAAVAPPGAPLVAQARSFNALGVLRGSAGDPEGALDANQRGLAVEETIGGPIEIAIGHNNVAEYALRLGRVDEAAVHQLQALELAGQIGSIGLVGSSLVIAARVAAAGDHWDETAVLHAAADRWLEESGIALMGSDADISRALLDEARSRLGDRYETFTERGGSLSLVDAIDAARRALSEATGR